MRQHLAAVALACLCAPSLPAAAEEKPACERFAWSVARESDAFTKTDLPTLAPGEALPSETDVVVLLLKPASDLTLPIASKRASEPSGFGGFVRIAAPVSAGTYQVTLSAEGWIDLSQDGRTPLEPIAHTGQRTCASVRKSVRYSLTSEPVTIQVSRAPADRVKLAVSKVD